jgi:MarR family transcriptional regulator, transcriptional regulator for hemolysin
MSTRGHVGNGSGTARGARRAKPPLRSLSARTPPPRASEREISRCFYDWTPDGAVAGSLEDKKLRLTRRILFLSRRWLNQIDNALRTTGDSHARWVTLLWVGMMAGRAKTGEIAEQVGVELPTLVRLLNRLEQEGLVVRRSLGGSNRPKTVVLTTRGRRESEAMNAVVTRERAEFLQNVDEERLMAALGLLDELLAKYTRVIMWRDES